MRPVAVAVEAMTPRKFTDPAIVLDDVPDPLNVMLRATVAVSVVDARPCEWMDSVTFLVDPVKVVDDRPCEVMDNRTSLVTPANVDALAARECIASWRLVTVALTEDDATASATIEP